VVESQRASVSGVRMFG